jgi:outer membrane protein assembly factor BamE
MKKPMRTLFAPLAGAFVLAGCGGFPIIPGITPYRMEIQQGNFITQDMVSRLKAGMTREQVRFILGTPSVADVFHADRWDYVFSRQRVNSTEVEKRRIAVYFEEGKLKRIEGDVVPEGTPQKAAGGAP